MPSQSIEDSSDLRLDTHWTRFVYCDEPLDEDAVVAHRDTPAPNLRRGVPGNDDVCEDARSGWPLSDELQMAARTNRGVVIRTLVLRAIQSAREWVRNALARYRRRRDMRAIYHTLRSLDDRSLRDLGFHRSEIMSVAAEAVEEAERTRVHTLRMPRAPRW